MRHGKKLRTEAGEALSVTASPAVPPEPTPVGDLSRRLERAIDQVPARPGPVLSSQQATSTHLLTKSLEVVAQMERECRRSRREADSLRQKLVETTARLAIRSAVDDYNVRAREPQETVQLREVVEDLQASLASMTERNERLTASGARQLMELAARDRKLSALKAELEATRSRRDAAERAYEGLQQRLSWRITAPLRFLRSLLGSKIPPPGE